MSRTRIATAVAVSFILLTLTGRLATRAFPLESPASPTGQAGPSPQAKRPTGVSLRAPSLAVRPEELSLIHQTKPSYPSEAKIQRIQGEVLLAVDLNEKGEVENMEVLKGPASLVLSALDAVKQWRYAPYLKDGVAVPVSSTVTVNFVLAGSITAAEQIQHATMVRTNERVTLRTPPLAYRVEPIYPLEAKEKGIEGEVRFGLKVNEQGDVIDVEVLGGNAMLVPAAYEAVRQWKYPSAFLDGVPIRVNISVAIKFELNPKGAATGSTPAADIRPVVLDAPQAEWLRQRPSEEELKRRVEYANLRFASDGVSGSKTDRGRVYVEWGPPYQIETHPSGGPVSESVALQISWLDRDENNPFEIWTYRRIEQGKAVTDLLVGFVGKDYRLASPKAH